MKTCKQGYYYCYTDKKCKKVPLGYHIGARGYLAKDNENDGEENENGNGNGGNGNGGGVSESKSGDSIMAKSRICSKRNANLQHLDIYSLII